MALAVHALLLEVGAGELLGEEDLGAQFGLGDEDVLEEEGG